MDKRLPSLAARLIVGLLAAFSLGTAPAQENASSALDRQRADWARRLEEAKAMQQEGVAMKNAAKEAFEKRKAECLKKFRVNDCQNEAKHQFNQATIEARRVENEGLARERQVKKEELADKDARRLAKEPQRQADLETREADTRAQRERDEASRDDRLAEKEEKARVGAERRAAAEERLRKKQEQHEKKLIEKMGKARQPEAEDSR